MKIETGQPLLDGIAVAVSDWRVAVVRRPSGELVVGAVRAHRNPFASVPFVRGLVSWFVEAPVEQEWAAKVLASEGPAPDLIAPGTRSLARSVAVLVVVQAALQLATYVVLRAFHHAAAPSSAAFQVAMALTIFFIGGLYLRLIVRVPDVRRVFELNAALKMVLWAAGDPAEPTPATLRRHPTWHPRSSLFAYLLLVVFLALLTVVVLAPLPAAHGTGLVAHAVTCGTRVLLTPIVVGFVEELQRLLAERGHGPAVRWTFAPFALLDRIVSVAPTEASLDVAAAALRELRARSTPPSASSASRS